MLRRFIILGWIAAGANFAHGQHKRETSSPIAPPPTSRPATSAPGLEETRFADLNLAYQELPSTSLTDIDRATSHQLLCVGKDGEKKHLRFYFYNDRSAPKWDVGASRFAVWSRPGVVPKNDAELRLDDEARKKEEFGLATPKNNQEIQDGSAVYQSGVAGGTSSTEELNLIRFYKDEKGRAQPFVKLVSLKKQLQPLDGKFKETARREYFCAAPDKVAALAGNAKTEKQLPQLQTVFDRSPAATNADLDQDRSVELYCRSDLPDWDRTHVALTMISTGQYLNDDLKKSTYGFSIVHTVTRQTPSWYQEFHKQKKGLSAHYFPPTGKEIQNGAIHIENDFDAAHKIDSGQGSAWDIRFPAGPRGKPILRIEGKYTDARGAKKSFLTICY